MAKTDAVTLFYKNLNRKRYEILPDSNLRAVIEASLPEYMALPEYQGWSEGDVFADVLSKRELKAAKYRAADSKYLASINSRPNSLEYGECSYEEILDMADNGVNIPEDLLEWARAMANEDSINYEVDDSASTDSGFLTEMQSDLNDDKTAASKANVQKYSAKAEAQNELLEKKTDEVEAQNQDLEYNQKTLEQEQNKSNSRIEEYNKELNSLEQKINNGENLTSNEQMRYKVLSGKINDENNTIIAKSENVQAEVESLLDSMGDVNSLLNINKQISDQLNLKNVTFVSQETKSNSGTLPIINKHIFNSNNIYLSKTLAGNMFLNMIDITQDIQINTDVAKLNVMNANSTALEINKDITNIKNDFKDTDTATNIDNITSEETPETNTENETTETTEEDKTNTTTPETENIMPETQEDNLEVKMETETEPETELEPEPEIPQDTIEPEEQEENPISETSMPETSMSENDEVDKNAPVAKTLKEAPTSQIKDEKTVKPKFNFANKIAELSQKSTETKQNPLSKTDSNKNQNNIISNNESGTNENTTNSNETSQSDEENVNKQGSTAQKTSKNTLSRSAQAERDRADNISKAAKHKSKLKQNEKKIEKILKENNKIQSQAKTLNDNKKQIVNSLSAETQDTENIDQNETENKQAETDAELKEIQTQSKSMKTKLKKNDKDVDKLEKDSSKDSKEIIQTAKNDETIEAADKAATDQNAKRHVTLSERILDIKEIFKKTKIAGQALMLSPWTHSIGVTMFDIGRNGENISTTANKFVQIAHLDLISTGSKISNVQDSLQDLEAQSSSSIKGVDKAAKQADTANDKAVNETSKTETSEDNQQAEVPATENNNEQTNAPVINSQTALKKENKEPLEITSSPDITEEADISINDISLEIDDNEIAQDNTEQIQQVTTKATEDSRAEYLKNPLINDDSASAGQEISAEIEEEAVNIIAQESAKESAQKSVKESVREVMQSTLSSVNKRVQSKDTDKDKKHKLFTQFEREKQDAMKKAVQKVNRARDAR